jgi:hypothetical protein
MNITSAEKGFGETAESTPDIDSWCENEGILTPLQSEYTCDFCNREGAFLRCGQCYTRYYCNRACQKKHWNAHKPDCLIFLKQLVENTKNSIHELEKVEKSYSENTGASCAVCFEVVPTTEQLQLTCHHVFCMSCMINYQQCNQARLKCPLCRSETEFHIAQHILEKASYFVQCVEFFPEESRTRCRFIQCSRREFDRLQSLRSSKRVIIGRTFHMDFIKVDLLFYEGKYDEAILLANELLELPQPSLPTKARTSLVVRIAQSHEKLCQYEKAYHALADLN